MREGEEKEGVFCLGVEGERGVVGLLFFCLEHFCFCGGGVNGRWREEETGEVDCGGWSERFRFGEG